MPPEDSTTIVDSIISDIIDNIPARLQYWETEDLDIPGLCDSILEDEERDANDDIENVEDIYNDFCVITFCQMTFVFCQMTLVV